MFHAQSFALTRKPSSASTSRNDSATAALRSTFIACRKTGRLTSTTRTQNTYGKAEGHDLPRHNPRSHGATNAHAVRIFLTVSSRPSAGEPGDGCGSWSRRTGADERCPRPDGTTRTRSSPRACDPAGWRTTILPAPGRPARDSDMSGAGTGPVDVASGGSSGPGDPSTRGRLRAVRERACIVGRLPRTTPSLLISALPEHTFCPDTAEVASSILAAPTISGPGEAPASPTSSSWTAVRRQRWDRGPGDPAPVPSR